MAEELIVRRKTEDVFFIHNVFGSFFSGVLDWWADEFYPRFNYKVIGSYDKAVEWFQKKKELGVDPSGNLLPSITLDPMFDFSPEERGGRFLWQHSTYAPGLGMRLWPSIDLKEQDVTVTPVFSRYQGTFELIFWLSSVYELFDFRMALLQFCGGFGRWLRPEFFWSYLILPEQIENFETGENTPLDWSNTYAETVHVDTINRHRLGVPIALDPMWKLDSLNDNSVKYGGDNIAEYKLSASFTYELNVPTYVVLNNKIDPQLILSISLGKTYSKYPLVSPYRIISTIDEEPSARKYFGDNYNIYKIANDTEAVENLILQFSDDTFVYPYKYLSWDPIRMGELIYVNDDFINDPTNSVHKDNIILIDSYKESLLPAVRRCSCVICINGTQSSEIYQKCEILKKPLITNLSDTDADNIKLWLDSSVTIDTLNRKLYTGLLTSVVVDSDDTDVAFETLQNIKQDDPELYKLAMERTKNEDLDSHLPEFDMTEHVDRMKRTVLESSCNGTQVNFPIGWMIDDKSLESLQVYIDDEKMGYGQDYHIRDNSIIRFSSAPVAGSKLEIGGQFLVVKESKLAAVYEFTQTDVDNIDSPPVMKLPEKLTRREDLVTVSYNGKMEYEKDYTLDFEAQTVTILLKPIVGEIVEFFYYV